MRGRAPFRQSSALFEAGAPVDPRLHPCRAAACRHRHLWRAVPDPARLSSGRERSDHLCACARRLARHGGIWIYRGRKRRLSGLAARSEEHTSELQSLIRISYAVFCLKKKKNNNKTNKQKV